MIKMEALHVRFGAGTRWFRGCFESCMVAGKREEGSAQGEEEEEDLEFSRQKTNE